MIKTAAEKFKELLDKHPEFKATAMLMLQLELAKRTAKSK
jgi:hypothetical protein